jgi:hypothetical protein
MEALSLLKGGIELAVALKRLLPEREKREKALQDRICLALRAIYFTPTGVVSLLHDVAEGKKISEERLRRILGDFNDKQWKVENAVRGIGFQELGRELGISLSTLHALTDLQYGKMNLRGQIQDEVNRYGQIGARPNKAKIKKLIGAIEELNEAIEAIENVARDKPIVSLPSRRAPAKKASSRRVKKAAKKK